MIIVLFYVSVQFSRSVVSDSLWPNGLQHTRLPCPSPTPRACSNSCPSSWWCHQTISSSVVPFSSCLQSLPASGSFQISQFFTSGGQNIGASASASILSMNTQDWFPLGLTGLISLLSKELSRVFSNTTVQKQILQCSAFFIVQLSHPYMTTAKTIALTRWTFVSKVTSLLFHMLSRLVIALLPRIKNLLISWLQSPSAVILDPRKTFIFLCIKFSRYLISIYSIHGSLWNTERWRGFRSAGKAVCFVVRRLLKLTQYMTLAAVSQLL